MKRIEHFDVTTQLLRVVLKLFFLVKESALMGKMIGNENCQSVEKD